MHHILDKTKTNRFSVSRANDGRHYESLPTAVERCGSLIIRHEAEVANPHETLRQNVYEKPADELVGGDGHQTLLITASVISPMERDVVAIEGDQSMIRDGDAVGIASQVAKHLFGSAERRLCINHPVLTE